MEKRFVPFADIIASYSDAPHRRLVDLRPDGVAEVSQFGRLSYNKARPDIPLHRHFGIIEFHFRERGEQYWQLGDQTHHMEGGDLFVTLPDEVHSSGGHPVAPGVMYWFGVRLPPEHNGMLGLNGKESWEIIQRLLDIPCRHFRNEPNQAFVDRDTSIALQGGCLHANRLLATNADSLAAGGHHGRRKSRQSASFRPNGRHHAHDLRQSGPGISTPEFGAAGSLFLVAVQESIQGGDGRIALAIHRGRENRRRQKRLAAGNDPVTEIASSLGFASSQHFATVFKRITGITPRAYRSGAFPHGPSHRRDDGQD